MLKRFKILIVLALIVSLIIPSSAPSADEDPPETGYVSVFLEAVDTDYNAVSGAEFAAYPVDAYPDTVFTDCRVRPLPFRYSRTVWDPYCQMKPDIISKTVRSAGTIFMF